VPDGAIVIIGGTSGIGRALAETYVARGRTVLEAVRARPPLGRLITMSERADAAAFLPENGPVNGVNPGRRWRLAADVSRCARP
jgi:NAD(P)-dependent dehydrogenase (short-subunit alcohol dehydrogenase family)